MVDLQDRSRRPTLEEMGTYTGNPVFLQFCSAVKERYACKEHVEFSSCSWEPGWNIKFKKAGKTLCTVYPKETFIQVMVVIGKREKAPVEALLPSCSPALRELYAQTREGNGQRWLAAVLEDDGEMYRDLFRLLDIRRG